MAEDLESDVASVVYTINGITYNLKRQFVPLIGYTNNWFGGPSSDSLGPGTHSLVLVVTNNNELSTTKSGTFGIYTEIQGNWYINDIEITEPTQILRLTTYTLMFKFVKTHGVPDNMITCTVDWSGPETGTLPLTNTAANTWTGTHTYTKGGTYTITLTANDGTNTITFTIFNIDIQKGWTIPPLSTSQQIGVALTLIGIALVVIPLIKKKE